jgi:hypothetical protein
VPTGAYYKVVNRANGKALDTGGQTADGTAVQMWFDNTSNNQQWTFEFINSATSLAATTATTRSEVTTTRDAGAATSSVQVLIDPTVRELSVTLAKGYAGEKRVSIEGRGGLVWAEGAFSGFAATLSTADIPAGAYTLRVTGSMGTIEERKILIRP